MRIFLDTADPDDSWERLLRHLLISALWILRVGAVPGVYSSSLSRDRLTAWVLVGSRRLLCILFSLPTANELSFFPRGFLANRTGEYIPAESSNRLSDYAASLGQLSPKMLFSPCILIKTSISGRFSFEPGVI